MLPQNSLKTKIFISFAVIASLLALNGIVSYFRSTKLRSEVNRIQEIEGVNAAVLKVDRDVQELRLRVDRYVTSGYDSQREEAVGTYNRLKKLIDNTKQKVSSSDISVVFNEISKHVEEYIQQFEAIVLERSNRRDLYQVQLPNKSEIVQLAFAEKGSLSGDLDTEQLLEISKARAVFTEAEKLFARYFDTPDSNYVNQAVKLLEDSKAMIRLSGMSSELQKKSVDAINDYQKNGLRAVQSTRSYLFFLNVVMAGEASEISHFSKLLREQTEQSRNLITKQITRTSDIGQRLTLFTVIAASLLALIIAIRLAYEIITPITALTATFLKLSEGESVSEVPGTKRGDEIGQMAQAARVFSDQNTRTSDLLYESQALSKGLESQKIQLEATNSELDNFAYIASHDLKSPLRGIRQLASWIEEDSGKDLCAESLKHLEHLQNRIIKMEGLLDDLLNYSRVGRTTPEPEVVNVVKLIEEILEITDNPKEIEVNWPRDLPTFRTLRSPLKQAFMNLIGNAIKHNDKEAEGHIEITWRTKDSHYLFGISDNGPGIESKHHQRIFQMYQRLSKSSVDGTGMGLAIVKKQVEQLGGEITVNSSLNSGANFEFTWPINMPALSSESIK